MNVTKTEFEGLYKENLPRLKSYLYRLVTSTEDMEDLAQETFIRAYKKIDSFEGRAGFKTWLFTIATNLVKDHYKAKKRWPINAQDKCSLSIKASPELQEKTMAIYHNQEPGTYEIKEHIDYCFTCVMKYLPLERHIAIMLADIYDFKVAEISKILSKSLGSVKHLLFNGRSTMKDIFGQDCSLINKTGACWKCSELSNSGATKDETEKKIKALELVKASQGSDKSELYRLRTELVKGIDPLEASGFNLHDFLLKQTDYASDKTYPATDKVCGD